MNKLTDELTQTLDALVLFQARNDYSTKLAHTQSDGVSTTPLPWLLATDFGERYLGATIAAAQTIVADSNNTHNEQFYLDAVVTTQYTPFDIHAAAKRFKDDLEQTVQAMEFSAQYKGNFEQPLLASFVVDPEKDRINVLSEWQYNGRTVLIAHPDHGQLTELIKDDTWKLIGAVEIDKPNIIPDREVAHEEHQLWDGHAAYTPAAAVAGLHNSIDVVGPRIHTLRYFTEDGTLAQIEIEDNQSRINQRTLQKASFTDHSNIVVHWIPTSDYHDIEQFRSLLPQKEGTTYHIARYDCVDDWLEAAASLHFAGVNIFKDAHATHLLVYDQSLDGARSVVADLTNHGNARVRVLAPNDEDNKSTTLLGDLYQTVGFDFVTQDSNPESLTDRLERALDPVESFPSEGDVYRNGEFKVTQIDRKTNTYEAAVFKADDNGNIMLYVNPYTLETLDYNRVVSVTLTHAKQTLGEFVVQQNYTRPDEETQPQRYENGLGGEPLMAILNPAHKGSIEGRTVPTRRAKLELAVPCGYLTRVLADEKNVSFKSGDRVQVSFNYK